MYPTITRGKELVPDDHQRKEAVLGGDQRNGLGIEGHQRKP